MARRRGGVLRHHPTLVRLLERLPELTSTPPETTHSAWLDCERVSLPENPTTFFLRHASVVVNDVVTFGRGSEKFVRLNVATSRTILGQMVDAMEDAVSKWHSAGSRTAWSE
jgi:cysteine-S-conjugate beta-lyase